MHFNFMKYAIDSAKEGVLKGNGGPFGACITHNGQIVAVAHNTVIKEHDPTCHAEMNVIRLATKTLGSHSLKNCELYSTSEPCPMCLSAAYWAGIDQIFIGVTREVAALYGFRDEMLYHELQRSYEDRLIPCTKGIMESDCKSLFTEWQKLSGPLY